MTSDSWSTSQLVEFLAVLSEQRDEEAALRAAVERVLEALDAEVGVLFSRYTVLAVVGLTAHDPQVEQLVAAARAGADTVTVDGLGRCRAAAATLDLGEDALRMLVVRAGTDGFVPDEMLLLRGMAWLLDLFGTELAMLYLADQGVLMVASVSTTVDERLQLSRPMHLRSGIGRAAYSHGELVRIDDYPASAYANPELVARGARAAMAAPVRENGAVVGSLVAVSFRPGHRFTDVQEQTLLAFADQVSIALSDAKTLATAQHAIRDAVTGLPNRVLFLDRLEQALDRGVRAHVLFLDLDRFKLVNDTQGHAAGDELLRQVGRRLRECLRSEDLLARFGGDEFAVLVEGAEVSIDGSIGIAVSDDGAGAGDILRDADTAMYRAKHAGGGRYVLFERRMHTVLVQRASLETDLRHAVARDELFLVFQPILELRGGQVHTAEALVRWQHPARGVIRPDEFIPLAEETGLIVPVGRRVLALACAQAAGWVTPPGGDGPPAVSVNLSARQLLNPELVRDVRRAVEATGLDPGRLILEITESAFVSDAGTVLERLRQIRDIGVRLAIDDFGTGYSALSYLRHLPVEILKIDRSFIEGVVAGWQGQAFLHTIVRLTDTLSMTAVGEGVETREQLAALRELGCRLGQGYLFARPMDSAQFSRSLAGHRGAVLLAG